MPEERRAEVKDLSVIQIIEKMVSEGQPEKKIIASLKTLGINEDQAKKLLLLGEANTFNLLRTEIKKLVSEELDAKKDSLNNFIAAQAQLEAKKTQGQILAELNNQISVFKESASKELDIFKDMQLSRQNDFQSRAEKTLTGVSSLIQKIESNTNELREKLGMFELDITEAKVKGFAVQNRNTKKWLYTFGVIFSALSLYLIFTFLRGDPSIETVFMTLTSGLIAAALLYVASIV
ncbi:MAG: hypothetical protein AB1467_00185 [Candidatus Diapherotrites archaeon]